MLVSLMARLNAANQMHNAQYAMMRNNMNLMSACRNLPYFGGNMAQLNEMDKNFALNQMRNESLYMLASMQYDSARQMQNQAYKVNKISYIA